MKAHLIHGLSLLTAFALGVAVDLPSRNVHSRTTTLTDSLVTDFHTAWNSEDIPAMSERLHPSAFFFSPHQLRYGRDVMESTVLVSNPPVIKVFNSEEWHSHVSDGIAWSIGKLYSHEEGDYGADYFYLFTPDRERGWKLQSLVYQEECD